MVAVSVSTDRSTYQRGEEVRATVVVTGAEVGGSKAVPVVASVTVNGVSYSAEVPVTVTWPSDDVVIVGVTLDGVPMVATADPAVWTGTAA
jgi:hypothetical protein